MLKEERAMQFMNRGARWAMAAVGAASVVGGALAMGVVSAQSPSPAPSAAPTQSPRPSGASRTPKPEKGQIAAKLAQALGIPQARVEQAIQQLGGQRGALGRGLKPVDSPAFSAAAQQLKVTPQQLSDALKAAAKDAMAQRQSGQQGNGPRGPRGARPDASVIAAAVAQKLGNGVTAAQVQAALGTLRPAQGAKPDRSQVQAAKDAHLQQFAQALGVTADQLKSALQSIHPDHQANGGPRPRNR